MAPMMSQNAPSRLVNEPAVRDTRTGTVYRQIMDGAINAFDLRAIKTTDGTLA